MTELVSPPSPIFIRFLELKLAGRPFSVGAACAIAVAIAFGLICQGFRYRRFFFKDREVPQMKRCPFCRAKNQKAVIVCEHCGQGLGNSNES